METSRERPKFVLAQGPKKQSVLNMLKNTIKNPLLFLNLERAPTWVVPGLFPLHFVSIVARMLCHDPKVIHPTPVQKFQKITEWTFVENC